MENPANRALVLLAFSEAASSVTSSRCEGVQTRRHCEARLISATENSCANPDVANALSDKVEMFLDMSEMTDPHLMRLCDLFSFFVPNSPFHIFFKIFIFYFSFLFRSFVWNFVIKYVFFSPSCKIDKS